MALQAVSRTRLVASERGHLEQGPGKVSSTMVAWEPSGRMTVTLSEARFATNIFCQEIGPRVAMSTGSSPTGRDCRSQVWPCPT